MPQFYTPPGISGYSWLNKPDTKYRQGGEYHVTLRLERKDPKVREMLQVIKDEFISCYSAEEYKQAVATMKKKAELTAKGDKSMNKVATGLPYTFVHDDDDEVLILKAKTYNRPKYGDSDGNTLDPDKGHTIPMLRSGSRLRLIVNFKKQKGHVGISCWLGTVQIIEVADGMTMEASGDSEGGSYVMEKDNGLSTLQNETSERVGAGQIPDDNEELVEDEDDDDEEF